jgi:Bacterial Ig-like domain (group 3)/Bacterial Ig-like domain/IPT/TIG domain
VAGRPAGRDLQQHRDPAHRQQPHGELRVNDGAANSNVATKTIGLTTPTPAITSLSPTSGPVGTTVVIAGSNFTGATAVRFNGTAADSYVVNSGTQITAVVAAGTTSGAATVVTPYGTSNGVTFSITSATTSTTLVSSVNPSTVGQSVTFTATVANVNGSATPNGTVSFRDGGAILGSGTLDGSGVATFSTSALTQGSHSIIAIYLGRTGFVSSTSATLTQQVGAPPLPALTSLSPTSGPVGTSVTITGTDLGGASSVSFNGVVQTTISNNTATSLTVNVPAGASTGDVEVTTAAGTSNGLPFTVTPPAPVVTSVSGPANGTYRLGQFVTFLVSFDQPVTVSTAGGTPVILMTVGSTPRGVTYFSGSTTSTLTFRYLVQAGDLDANGVTLGSSIAPNNGTLRNATGTDAVLTLNNVAPLTGVLVDGVVPTATVSTTAPSPTSSSAIPVTITFTEAVTGLTAAGLTVTNGTRGVLSGSGTTYTITVTATAAGAVTVQVPAGAAQDLAGNPNAASNTLSVTYSPPPVAISSFTPTSGAAGTVVVITGNGFTGATAVTINNGAVASYTVDSNTQITATVAASNSTGLIRVTSPAGTGVSSTNFVVGPSVNSVNIITANGTYRTGQQLQFNVVFSQPVTVNTTGGTPSLDVTVGGTVRQATYTGTASSTAAFRYTIVAGDLDTDGVTLGGSIDLNGGTIRNSGGADADLDLNNVGATTGLLVDGVAPTVTVSSTAGASGGSTAASPIPLTITFSESVTGFTSSDVAVTGGTRGTFTGSGSAYSLSVTPTGGTVTVNIAAGVARDAALNDNEAAPTFTILYLPAPAISSFTPTSGAAGTTVSLTGTNLTGATAITFTGSSGNVVTTGFTVVSGTSITGIVVPAGASTGPLTVTTPGGTSAASPASFRVAPTVSSLSVAAELPGQSVLITGRNFTSGSTVTFGGVAAGSVTYVSPTSLTATVPAGAAAGTRAVVVTTPNGSSAGSPAFEVLQVYRTATASGCLSTVAVTLDGTGGANSWLYLRLPAAQGGAVVAAIENTLNLGAVTAGVLAQGTGTSQPVRQDGNGLRYLDRNFYLTATNPAFAGQSVRVRFFGLNSELSRLGVTAANLNVSQYDGPNEDCDLTNNSGLSRQRLLDAPASVLSGADWFTAEVTVPDHFSEFYLTGASQPLPVQLTRFTAAAAGPSAVALAWTTAQELNSAYFTVERSADGRAFTTIGRVAAAGRSTAARAYQLLDSLAPADAPVLYYRLRSVDQDDTFAYSAVQTVRRAATAGQLLLYPNPTRTTATLTGAAPGAPVQLLDALGRVLLTTPADAAGTARLLLPPGCPTGVYLVRCGARTTRLLVE